MRKRSQKLKIVSPRIFNEIPKLKGGEVFITPQSKFLMDDSCRPYKNNGNWPEWWKNLSGNEGSVKRCSGTSDYLASGFTIPLWASLMFRPSINGKMWEVKFDLTNEVGDFGIEGFSYDQTGECPVSKIRKLPQANYIKVINPWLIKTAPGWSCLFLPTLWDPNPNYTMLPAIVNTDYYHNAHMVMNILTDEPFELEAGKAIWHVIPFKREKDIKITWGDEIAYTLLRWRGFGGAFMAKRQKSKYKRMQREADAEVQVNNKSLFSKIFKSKN
jgi:hypothetical protein